MTEVKLDIHERELCPGCDGTRFTMVEKNKSRRFRGADLVERVVERTVMVAVPCDRCGHTTGLARRIAQQRRRLERQDDTPADSTEPKPLADISEGMSLAEIARRAKEHRQ